MTNKTALPSTALVPLEPQAAFLELAPPHWAARGLAYAIILVVALGALAAVAIKMPEPGAVGTRPFAPGMSGQAHIVVGKRSLLSYIFEPLRQLKENMADVPEQVSKR